jgi:ArsR family transcriptional regulator
MITLLDKFMEVEHLSSGCCQAPRALPLAKEALRARAQQFKALGHPVRLQIVAMLAQAAKPLCVCDIEAHFELKQPTISHHLRWLREAGLLVAETRGPYTYYHLKPQALAAVGEWLQHLAA